MPKPKSGKKIIPMGFSLNDNNHLMIEITGSGFKGSEEEIRVLDLLGYAASRNGGKPMLESMEYDRKHGLVGGQKYRVVLFTLGDEIAKDSKISTDDVLESVRRFNYQKPLGGVMPSLRRMIHGTQMMKMKIRRIIALHDPIDIPGSEPKVFTITDCGWLDGISVLPGTLWGDCDAFIFFDPVP